MCFLRFLVSTQILGFTFGASFSNPHIPIHRPPNPSCSPSSGKELQWPRCVSKQSGCEMAEICRQASLPSPLLLSSPLCMFHFPPLGGGMRLVFPFCCWLSSIHKKRTEGVFFSSASRVLTSFLKIRLQRFVPD